MLLLLLAVLTITAYLYVKYCYTYWDRKNIPSVKPTFLLGSVDKILKLPLVDFDDYVYKSSEESMVGFYLLIWPVLLLRNADICRRILTKDYKFFPQRGFYVNEKVDCFSGNLVGLDGERAMPLKNKLAPAFSTGKIRGMFEGFLSTNKILTDYLEQEVKDGADVNVTDLASKYSINVFSSLLFGMNINAFVDPDIPVSKAAKIFVKPLLEVYIRLNITFFMPKLGHFLRMRTMTSAYKKIIMSILKKIIEDREERGEKKIDLMQLMLQLRHSGVIKDDDDWDFKLNDDKSHMMSVDEIAAHIHTFLIGGHDNSALAISYCLFELAKNPEVQARVHEEIRDVLSRHNNEITYESVSEMKYLEWCILESLRLYPSTVNLLRQCVQDYYVPEMDVTIDKGTILIMPLRSLHMDPRYYDNPEEFQPERFKEMTRSKSNLFYQAFGQGPRQCIARNLGILVSKVSVLAFLLGYNVHLGTELEKSRKINFARHAFLLAAEKDVKLKFTKKEV